MTKTEAIIKLACSGLICIVIIGVVGRALGVDPVVRDILLAVSLGGVVVQWARHDA